VIKESLDQQAGQGPCPSTRLAVGGAQAWQGEIEGRAKHGARRVGGALEARNGNGAREFIHPVALVATLPRHGEVVIAGDTRLAP